MRESLALEGHELGLPQEIKHITMWSTGHGLHDTVDHSVPTLSPLVDCRAQVRKILDCYGLWHSLRPELDQLPETALFGPRFSLNFTNTHQERNKPVGDYALFKGNCLQIETGSACLLDANPCLAVAEILVGISAGDCHRLRSRFRAWPRTIHFTHLCGRTLAFGPRPSEAHELRTIETSRTAL